MFECPHLWDMLLHGKMTSTWQTSFLGESGLAWEAEAMNQTNWKNIEKMKNIKSRPFKKNFHRRTQAVPSMHRLCMCDFNQTRTKHNDSYEWRLGLQEMTRQTQFPGASPASLLMPGQVLASSTATNYDCRLESWKLWNRQQVTRVPTVYPSKQFKTLS